MSVFDLFRGFFGVPGGHYRGRRDPFFDAMTREEDDDDDDEEDGFYFDGFHRDHPDPGGAWRFGFSVGPEGMRLQEPQAFGQMFREMEEIFSQFGHIGVAVLPPSQDRGETGKWGSSGNPLRDFMLRSPDSDSPRARGPPEEPQHDSLPSDKSRVSPRSPFHGWKPFSQFDDIWNKGPQTFPEDERREDRDLDSAVSSRGLDHILAPPAGQIPNEPKGRSFFQSVTVTKVVKPDGSVEERRTIRDSHGKEETSVTVSGGPGSVEGPDYQTGPFKPDNRQPFSDMRDDYSFFSELFGSFKK